MSHFRRATRTLEFNKITEMLASCASTEGAKLLARNLMPEADTVRVKRLQAETSAARYLASKKGAPSFCSIKDASDSIEKAAKHATLTTGELIEIGNVLRTARGVLDYIKDGNAEETVIDELFFRLTPNRFLEEKIYRSIPTEDFVADEASPALGDLRRKIRSAQAAVRNTLTKYISGAYSKYLQENLVTVKNGRYVVPVKVEYKNEIKGLIHDTSATGATVFIEPYAVVEANNELRELQSKEAREIERILASLSKECAEYGQQINLNYMNLTLLAFIFAKAELANRLDACEPTINEKHYFSLEKARHPLLDAKTVVPISVSLGVDFDTLVITGPNTGGKTVTLKTLGLFALMAQSGLHLPCKEADICIFDAILADIGDEQSIEQSLSTFSSHMTGILDILNKVDKDSLVLFDELGSGTDPIEGAAIAISVLEEIRSYGALCAATTHYSELKEYALNTDGVTNAGCEFDVDTLKPTFRLIIGTPGRSNAFAISERIGISRTIIERAKKYISAENRRVEDSIASLDKQRIELDRQKAELDAREVRFRDYEDKKRRELEALNERTHRDTQNLRDQAARMIESARATSSFVFDKLDRLQRQSAKELTKEGLDRAREEIRSGLRTSEGTLIPTDIPDDEDYTLPRPLKAGDEVRVVGIDKTGTVLKTADKDGDVSVRIGMITTKVSESKLRLIEKKSKKTEKKTGAVTKTLVQKTFKAEIDLRGMTGDEAWFAVDKYIDDAYMAGFFTVSLIHGKGTGALRQALWTALKKEPRVASFRLGGYGEGDGGVTIIEIKH